MKTPALLATLRPAMLPMDGNIASEVPRIFAAFEALVPAGRWGEVAYIDLTAGSCLLPMLFGARGVGRLVVNDPAPRTGVAARALFGGRAIAFEQVRDLVASPRTRPHVPSFHFACDYLTRPVADIFDRLYHADVPDAQADGLRYLALLWVLGFTRSVADGFEVLLTHAEDQLRATRGRHWARYLDRSHRPLPVLRALVQAVNKAIATQRGGAVTIAAEDMAVLCRKIDYRGHCFVAANPPTNGLDEYVIDDQIVHSLLANRWLPLEQCRETARAFWRSRVDAALAAAPIGALCLVWGGDGALSLAQCNAAWRRHGTPVVERKVPRSTAGWMILRRE